jgi:uncharacterized protein (TIGR02588 family)
MADKNSENPDDQKEKQIPFLEWLIAAIGLVLVVGTIGFMLYQAFTVKDTPPSFKTNVERIEQVNSGYIVIFKIINEGEQTASGVEIEGEIKDGDKIIETSGVSLDYVPSKSESKGGLFFKQNPKQFQLEIRAKGYSEP